MRVIEDRYNGVIVDSNSLPQSCGQFKSELLSVIHEYKNKKLLWIKVSSDCSEFIPILTSLDFEFHHCAESDLMLVKKLSDNPVMPNAKNHTVGVGGLVYDGSHLLTVKDRFSKGYKLPGGLVDPSETLEEALVREVFEESGVEVKFNAIINVGHFTKGQFGEQNVYFVCLAKALTTEINIQDSSEIIDARWMNAHGFLNDAKVNAYNKAVVRSFVKGEHSSLLKKTVQLKTECELFL